MGYEVAGPRRLFLSESHEIFNFVSSLFAGCCAPSMCTVQQHAVRPGNQLPFLEVYVNFGARAEVVAILSRHPFVELPRRESETTQSKSNEKSARFRGTGLRGPDFDKPSGSRVSAAGTMLNDSREVVVFCVVIETGPFSHIFRFSRPSKINNELRSRERQLKRSKIRHDIAGWRGRSRYGRGMFARRIKNGVSTRVEKDTVKRCKIKLLQHIVFFRRMIWWVRTAPNSNRL